jgi:hypothetical protein
MHKGPRKRPSFFADALGRAASKTPPDGRRRRSFFGGSN